MDKERTLFGAENGLLDVQERKEFTFTASTVRKGLSELEYGLFFAMMWSKARFLNLHKLCRAANLR